jgi:hypothetical protein
MNVKRPITQINRSCPGGSIMGSPLSSALRKVLCRFVLPIGILFALGVFCLKSYLHSLWNASLRAAVADADRLVIHDLGFDGEERQPDCEIRGADKIQELFQLIDIDAGSSGFHCMCDGEYWLQVYEGDREILTLGYHHGRSLRWQKGKWNGDGALTAASQVALPAWFQKNGCAYLQQLCDRRLAERKRQAEEKDRFASFFPEKTRKMLLSPADPSGDKKATAALGKLIAEQIGDGQAVALVGQQV